MKQQEDDASVAITALAAVDSNRQGYAHVGAPTFAAGDASGSVSFYEDTGSLVGEKVALSPRDASVMAVEMMAVSEDGALLLAALHRTIGTYDFNPASDNYSHLGLVSIPDRRLLGALVPMHRNASAMAFGSDGTLAAVTGYSGAVDKSSSLLVYATRNMQLLRVIPIPDDYDVPRALRVSRDGRAQSVTRFMAESSWPIGFDNLLQESANRLEQWNREDRYRGLMQSAESARQRGDRASAVSALTEAGLLRSDIAEPFLKLGNIVYEPSTASGDKSAAASAYDKAVSVNPYEILARVRRGRFRYFTGDFHGAEEDYRAALNLPMAYITPVPMPFATINDTLAPWTVKLRQNAKYEPQAFLGYVLFAEGKWRDAVFELTKAIADYGGSVRDYEMRGQARARLGDSFGALEDISEAFGRLTKSDGAYSGLDDYKFKSSTEAGRQRLLCGFSTSGADWTEQIGSPEMQNNRRLWLRRAFDACSKAWRAVPQPGAPGPQEIAQLRDKLARLGVAAEASDEVTLSIAEQLRRLLFKSDPAELEAFRKHFAAFPEAAEAGLAAARTSVGNAQERSDAGISGIWKTDDETQLIRIEQSADGKEEWRDLKAGSPLEGQIIAETVFQEGVGRWRHVGRHKWQGNPPVWGADNALVCERVSKTELYYAYLDSRYEGGWILHSSASPPESADGLSFAGAPY